MELFTQVIQSTRTAATVAATTTGIGLGTLLDLIPDNIGKLATLIGVILSIVLIYAHVKKGRLERKLLELKIRQEECKHCSKP